VKYYLSNASMYCLFDLLSSAQLGKVGGTHSIVWILHVLKMLFQADEKSRTHRVWSVTPSYRPITRLAVSRGNLQWGPIC